MGSNEGGDISGIGGPFSRQAYFVSEEIRKGEKAMHSMVNFQLGGYWNC